MTQLEIRWTKDIKKKEKKITNLKFKIKNRTYNIANLLYSYGHHGKCLILHYKKPTKEINLLMPTITSTK